MKCQIRLLTIFVILLNFSILEAKAIKSSDVIVWPLVLQKIESICNQGNYDSAFNVLTETYTQYKLSTQNLETYKVNWCHSSEMSVGKGVVVKLFLLPYRCSYDTIITDCDICVSSVPYCGNDYGQNESSAEQKCGIPVPCAQRL